MARMPWGPRNSSSSSIADRIRRRRVSPTSESIRRPSALGSSTWRSAGTTSAKRPRNCPMRSRITGYALASSPSKTVVAQNGSRPTSERTRSGTVSPPGIRSTS